MTTIKATCPVCGDVDLVPADLRVVTAPAAGWSTYEFGCPRCGGLVHKDANDDVVSLLVGAGVYVEVLDIPAEALEEHDGPAITYDDVLDFALRMESVDDLASVIAHELSR